MIEQLIRRSGTKYSLTYFARNFPDIIEKLRNNLVERKGTYYIKCAVREENGNPKEVHAKPEELVRQAFLHLLLDYYEYDKSQIKVEYPISDKSEDLVDIVVFYEPYIDESTKKKIIFELKRTNIKEGLGQLKRYLKLGDTKIGIWSNGEVVEIYKKERNKLVPFPRILKNSEDIGDIERVERDWKFLVENDQLSLGMTTLKKTLLNMEEIILANAGIDDFREIFKLIFAKLMDEYLAFINYKNGESYELKFTTNVIVKEEKDGKVIKKVREKSEDEVFSDISNLFDKAKRQWSGIFENSDKIKLRKSQLYDCVSFLQYIKLFNSNLQIIDEAFEHLIVKITKKKHGQYFTPRPIIDFGIEVTKPKMSDIILDPACGSAGFIVHTLSYLQSGKITASGLKPEVKEYAKDNVLMFDFSEDAVKIAKAINIIIGDGKNNVFKVNSLDIKSWREDENLLSKLISLYIKKKNLVNETKKIFNIFIPPNLKGKEDIVIIKDGEKINTKKLSFNKDEITKVILQIIIARLIKKDSWRDLEASLLKKIAIQTEDGQQVFSTENLNTEKELLDYFFRKIRGHVGIEFLNYELNIFDKIYTNPPFAGKIKEKELLELYELGKGRKQSERHILFIERCIRLLSPNGILYIILPEGIFTNLSASYIRRFLLENGEILGVISLHRNTFKPHTSTKTSALFFRKFTDEERQEIINHKVELEASFENLVRSLESVLNEIKNYLYSSLSEITDDRFTFLADNVWELITRTISQSDIEIIEEFLLTYMESVEEILEKIKGEYIPFSDEEYIQFLLSEINNLREIIEEKKAQIEEYEQIKAELDELKKNYGNLKAIKRKLNCRRRENKARCEELKREIDEVKGLIDKLQKELPPKREINKLYIQIGGIEKKITEELLPKLVWKFSAFKPLAIVLSDKLKKEFKDFYLERKLLENLPHCLNYEVCFGINQVPIKNNKGEYRYKVKYNGILETDQNGHPIVDTDLFELGNCIREKISKINEKEF